MDGAGFEPISPLMAVTRALAQRGSGIYKLGGAAHFRAPSVYDPLENRYPGYADCTGLMAYALKYRRNQWNTDTIVLDAKGAQKRFHVVPANVPIRPSDMLITGNLEDGPDHAGMIVEVLNTFVRGAEDWWKHLRVCHCSGYLQLTPDPARPGHLYGATRVDNASRWRKVSNGHYSRIIRANHVTNEGMSMPDGPLKEREKPSDAESAIDTSPVTAAASAAPIVIGAGLGYGTLVLTGIV